MQASKMHWRIVESILNEIQCAVTFINYPLTPENTCGDTINMAADTYAYLCCENCQKMILMGDSAGGGLALALAQHIKAKDSMRKPSKIVLLSPWLDVSMDNDISVEQVSKELILDEETLKTIGKTYAGDLDTKNPLCSPLYGEMADIGEIALFTGTSEVLNMQAEILKEKATRNNNSPAYYEYEDMQHVWICFPIPEAKDAMEKICAFIKV